ncbi:biotin-dependent carboxyltransferase family protein [Paramicrobacterium chengjingii]|uniref:Biotin-dependent carboxyltransferase family protein n=1 Tax=Paramicrobacterium chengjingii TaxID=2769067 RepID=A0ABX6YK11_9MICO|nr:biotin-dependent carboxyltransferase family protein [Microbacterium chengjingii]QPZ39108.1 biotin-dependent carboxyltransferase family protein [Microbacterium chengjingii]
MTLLTIVESGPLTTVQDLGRPGFAHIGVPRSGALDRSALRLANRLVGNSEADAALEITVGGFEARTNADVWVAVTGAWCPISVGGEQIDPNTPVRARAGQTIRVDAAVGGLRAYLSVRGGIDATAVLGSRSRDTLSGLGPEPLAPGDELGVGREPDAPIPALEISPWSPPSDERVEVPVVLGPRQEWFEDAEIEAFLGTVWALDAASNRVGARLVGDPVTRRTDAELPSEGMVAGAIQIPPSGLPTVLLADHPVTGGYPVIGIVSSAAIDAFAQLRPGQKLTFRHA